MQFGVLYFGKFYQIKNMLLKLLTKKLFIITTIFFMAISFSANAQIDVEVMLEANFQAGAFAEGAGYDNTTTPNYVPNTIATIIKVLLGFLGMIFIILVIWAGYSWMTAGGNEEKVTKAKTTIYRAVIGLIIIVSAYAITHFVFGAIDGAGGP